MRCALGGRVCGRRGETQVEYSTVVHLRAEDVRAAWVQCGCVCVRSARGGEGRGGLGGVRRPLRQRGVGGRAASPTRCARARWHCALRSQARARGDGDGADGADEGGMHTCARGGGARRLTSIAGRPVRASHVSGVLTERAPRGSCNAAAEIAGGVSRCNVGAASSRDRLHLPCPSPLSRPPEQPSPAGIYCTRVRYILYVDSRFHNSTIPTSQNRTDRRDPNRNVRVPSVPSPTVPHPPRLPYRTIPVQPSLLSLPSSVSIIPIASHSLLQLPFPFLLSPSSLSSLPPSIPTPPPRGQPQ